MKRLTVWMPVAILTICSTMTLLSACSSDTDDVMNNKTPVENTQTPTLGDMLLKVDDHLKALNFQELEPLRELLTGQTQEISHVHPELFMPLNSQQKEKLAELEKKTVMSLKNLLNQLMPQVTADEDLTLQKSWTFSNLSETVTLGMEVIANINLQKEEESKLLTGEFGQEFTSELEIKVNDTLTYQISIDETDKNIGQKGLLLNSNMQALTICRNEEPIFTVYGDNVGMLNTDEEPELYFGRHQGIIYKDFTINYEKVRHSLTQVVTNVSFLKGDGIIFKIQKERENTLNKENLLAHDVVSQSKYDITLLNGLGIVRGSVSNINKMYATLAQLLLIDVVGTTKENCDRLVNEFNELVTTDLAMIDVDMGNVYMETQLANSDKGSYKPVLIANLRMFGEPMPLGEAAGKIIKMLAEL